MKAKLTATLVKSLEPRATPYEIRDTEINGFLLRVQPSGTMTYYLDYRVKKGSRRNRYRIGSPGNVTPAQARDEAKRQAALVVQGTDLQVQKKEERQEAEQRRLRTLGAFLDEKYAQWAATELRTSEETLRRIRVNFEHLLPLPIDELSLWAIQKWRSEQLRKGKERSTVNRDVTALKAAISKAVEWKVVAAHPLADLKPLKLEEDGSPRYLTDAEEQRLRAALDAREARIRTQRDSANGWRNARGYRPLPSVSGTYADHLKPLVLLSLNTGARRGELFSLNWERIDLERRFLTVVGRYSKSQKTRHIPLNEEALSALRQWKSQGLDSGLVFPGKNGDRLDNVRKAWKGVLEAAGITAFRWHDLRHHFASRLVMQGVDLNTVRELLGHSDIKMTLRYSHLAPEHKAEAVARLVSA